MSNITYAYLFKIELLENNNNSNHILYFTSLPEKQSFNGNIYLPASLNITEANFDDSGNATVRIHGIFENNAIDKKYDLSGARLEIYHHRDGGFSKYVTVTCTEYENLDLEFYLNCSSYMVNYHGSLLQNFSRTCRADFMDSKCKISLERVSHLDVIVNYDQNENIVTLDRLDKPDGYFNDGTFFLEDNDHNLQCNIIFQKGNVVKLSSLNSTSKMLIKQGLMIKMVPTCNKTHLSCCYYFNNIVNFRGEAYLPEFHDATKNWSAN